jgi:CO/xanthine dehydrogenase Mo-binding subunit
MIGRRTFLYATLGTGASLVVGCGASPPVPATSVPAATTAVPPPAGPPFAPNAFVRVGADGVVTVIVDKAEMGQGVVTGLPMLVAEELEVDLSQVRTEFAPVDDAYNNTLLGVQATGGSTTIRSEYDLLRKAGAAARMMLVAAAARTWGVDEAGCHAEKGRSSTPRRGASWATASSPRKPPRFRCRRIRRSSPPPPSTSSARPRHASTPPTRPRAARSSASTSCARGWWSPSWRGRASSARS